MRVPIIGPFYVMIRAEKSIRQGPCESGTNDQGRVENAIYLRKILNFEPK